VVNPISGFSNKKCIMNFQNRKLICRTIKEKLTNIQNKLAEDTFGWTVQGTLKHF
jgi:branched-chain amino acid aminotransferase